MDILIFGLLFGLPVMYKRAVGGSVSLTGNCTACTPSFTGGSRHPASQP